LKDLKQRERTLRHYYANREAYIKRSADWKKNNPERHKIILKRYELKKKYNLSLEDYESMLEAQNNRCAICDSEEKLVVDHDHETGIVRGLLCYSCNRNLIANRRDPCVFIKAAKYLKKHWFDGKRMKI